MVGFVAGAAVDEEQDGFNQTSNPKGISNPLALLDQKLSDLSFADSFLDFESIQNWFEDIPMESATAQPGNFDGVKVEEGPSGREGAEEVLKPGSELKSGACEAVTGVFGSAVKVEIEDWEKLGTLGGSIEENLGRVSLACGSGVPVVADGISVKTEVGSDDGGYDRSLVPASGFDIDGTVNAAKGEQMIGNDHERGSSSESEGSSSTSSSASCGSADDGDTDTDNNDDLREEERGRVEVKGHVDEAGEMEEGEIREVDGGQESGEEKNDEDSDEDGQVVEDMVGWSDAEDEDDGVAGTGAKGGPIRSKNEVKGNGGIRDHIDIPIDGEFLPPVPPVNATLQPHHQMSPVGVVLSILGAQVIVEGVEKHSPLNEGSILWITETRTPLGLVDEIFGPVKNPYYIVRYNLEAEVPAGIHQGTSISSIPEFASLVLNEKNLYKKGYDASGENDEELSEEAEFSDDEKEAEYKRMQRMAKRSTNMDDQRAESRKNNKKKVRSRELNWKNGKPLPQQPPVRVGQHVLNQTQHKISPTAAPLDYGNFTTSSAIQPGNMGGIGTNSPFPLMQPNSSILPLHDTWVNGLPLQQPMGAISSNGIPIGMPWPPRGSQFPFQMPLPNQMPFQQQFDLSQGSLPSMVLPMGQSNTLGPGLAPWPNPMGQNNCNQMTVGVGAFGQSSHPIFNAGGQGFQFNGTPLDQSSYTQPHAAAPRPIDAPGPFKQRGPSFGRGKRPYRGRGGRFSGGRSQQRPH